MNENGLREMLEAVRTGHLGIGDALRKMKSLPYENLGFACVDSHRHLRKGFPEVIFCEGKQTSQIIEIARKLVADAGNLLATRAGENVFTEFRETFPDARYNRMGRTITINNQPLPERPGLVLIVTAGTSDIPVAEEAKETASIMGNRVETLYDVGVAGIHRLLGRKDLLWRAEVIIVVAGMDGALPGVVAGLVDKPVVAVPTSIGYGASFSGLAPLLTMLNACASGVAVVNIDNGFGAGQLASVINSVNLSGK